MIAKYVKMLCKIKPFCKCLKDGYCDRNSGGLGTWIESSRKGE